MNCVRSFSIQWLQSDGAPRHPVAPDILGRVLSQKNKNTPIHPILEASATPSLLGEQRRGYPARTAAPRRRIPGTCIGLLIPSALLLLPEAPEALDLTCKIVAAGEGNAEISFVPHVLWYGFGEYIQPADYGRPSNWNFTSAG